MRILSCVHLLDGEVDMGSRFPEKNNAVSLCQIDIKIFQDCWKPLVINFLANHWDVLRNSLACFFWIPLELVKQNYHGSLLYL